MSKINLRKQYLEIKREGCPALQAWLEDAHNIDQPNKFGFTSLHYAAGDGNVSVSRLLLSQSADVNAQTAYGYTLALCGAARRGGSGADAGAEIPGLPQTRSAGAR